MKRQLLLESTQLCQGLVKINGTRVSSDCGQAVCALNWAPHISQEHCTDIYCSGTFYSLRQGVCVCIYVYICNRR